MEVTELSGGFNTGKRRHALRQKAPYAMADFTDKIG